MTTATTPPGSLNKPLAVAFANVGCKLNQHELEALQNNFSRRGYTIVESEENADVCVVNTCTVTGAGDADSRKAVRRARRRNPNATVVATGCYAQRRPAELSESGADLVYGNDRKAELVAIVEAHLSGEPKPSQVIRSRAPHGRFIEIEGPVPLGRTRGTLKIQDGCDEHCTYCIIPTVRGPGISRPPDAVIQQAEKMVQSGYREIALTGVHSGSYGYDNGRPDSLASLLKRLDKVSGLQRVRLNSVEPAYVSDALIEHAATSTKFCRHFHIPLQSGDDNILKLMGRHYRRADYIATVERIHATIPDCALGCDVMVGFPGEEGGHYENTYRLLRDLPMTYLHVFPYSLRSNTPAERLPGHLSRSDKADRVQRLIALGKEKQMTFHRSFVGQRVYPLVEDRRDRTSGLQVGLTDNYLKVLLDHEDGRDGQHVGYDVGDIIDVQVTHARDDIVFGTLV